MKRKLAVPLAVSKVKDRAIKTRILKDTQDIDDVRVLATLAENRQRLEKLLRDLEQDGEFYETADTVLELEYIKASIQLELLETAGELEDTPYSDELMEEVAA